MRALTSLRPSHGLALALALCACDPTDQATRAARAPAEKADNIGLFDAPGMLRTDDGERAIGRWPRLAGRRTEHLRLDAAHTLRLDLKVAAWVEVWVDREQRLAERLRPGRHRIPGLLTAGTHMLELRSAAPVQAFVSAAPPRVGEHGLRGPVHAPRLGALLLEGQGTATVSVGCAGQTQQFSLEAGQARPLWPSDAPCPTVTDLDVRWQAPAQITDVRLLAPRAPAPRRPRNVVVVLVDTLRLDRVAAFDPTARPATPAMSRVAAESWVFGEAIAASNWTKPSVATLLTGWAPERHGATTHEARLPADAPFIPSEAAAHGFATAAFVSNGYITPQYGFGRGWSHFHAGGDTGRSRAHLLVEDALAWLDSPSGAGDRPFFLYVHTTDPHFPYAPPERVLSQYHAGAPALDVSNPRLLQLIDEGRVELSAAQRAELIDRYDAEVAYHDEAMGALYEGLRARQRLEDTLVVFVSDHGEELFDHGGTGHGGTRLWDELVRVPLLMRWPDGQPQQVSEAVGHADVAATLRWAMGLPGRDDSEGVPVVTPSYGALRVRRSTRPGTLVAITNGRERAIVPLRPGRALVLAPPDEDGLARLLHQLSALDLAYAPPRPALDSVNDQATLAQLRALGYIE